ncbi:Carboxypeptidase [Dirofilaria immitis]
MLLIYFISLFRITRTGYLESDFDFNKYHSLEEYENYLENIARSFPDMVQLQIIGYTHELRRLLCLKEEK